MSEVTTYVIEFYFSHLAFNHLNLSLFLKKHGNRNYLSAKLEPHTCNVSVHPGFTKKNY